MVDGRAASARMASGTEVPRRAPYRQPDTCRGPRIRSTLLAHPPAQHGELHDRIAGQRTVALLLALMLPSGPRAPLQSTVDLRRRQQQFQARAMSGNAPKAKVKQVAQQNPAVSRVIVGVLCFVLLGGGEWKGRACA